MKKYIYLPLLTMVLISFMGACKKKNDPTPQPPTIADKIVGDWKATKLVIDGTDVTAVFSCLTDDIITYKADGTYSEVVGANKCEDDETNESGSWKVSTEGGKDILTTTSGGTSEQATILSLDAKTMVVSLTNGAIVLEATFSKQ
ncbi:hypothetical protein BKI52_29460 [marine bacterium AO1-C]|nr:hypothetical protein BKI52_29460 [marine bacterium AO1-C]